MKRRIQATIDKLTRFPTMGKAIEKLPGVYKLVIPQLPYIAYYEVVQDEIRIARIYHGARDIAL